MTATLIRHAQWTVRVTLWLFPAALLAALALHLAFPLPTENLSRLHASFVYDRDGHLLTCFASPDSYWRQPVALSDISPHLIEAILACEDRWFYYHPGVNPVSLIGAAVDNLRAGHVVRGGSTITMQIARMMEPKERSYSGKVREMFRAVQLELSYSKDELLEMYLNLAPYGGNIDGVRAACTFYFDKPPAELTWSEIAILVALPSSPNRFRPDRHPTACRERRNTILNHLHHQGVLTADQHAAALAEEWPRARQGRPTTALHFSRDIAGRNPDRSTINSTINGRLQYLCERLATAYHTELTERGIHNLSLAVIHNATGDLLAAVGSPDFKDQRHSGQINGVRSLRSPGSTLKPFVYAAGFDIGLITPSSRLQDIPVNYAGYSPENYDEVYHGVVRADEALIQSFNVPAVNLTAEVGLTDFYNLLTAGGITSFNKQPAEYGLPLVLGCAEVSLLELTNLYATLGRQGLYRPVRDLLDAPVDSAYRILSPEASWLTTDILTSLQRPVLPSSWESTTGMPTVAWKTGTSYGRRDAWAVGCTPVYTIGVWAGNFSAEGSPYLVGAEAAAPLMLELFNEITGATEKDWFDRPPGIATREVCAVSGLLPGPACRHRVREVYIDGVSSLKGCDVHRVLFVDRATGFRLQPACAPTALVDTQIVVQWPARLSTWMIAQGQARPLPPLHPDCNSQTAEETPVITSPEPDAVFELVSGIPVEYQSILFEASAELTSGRVHWFLDDVWFASCESGGRVFYPPEPGNHRLLCVDETGRSSRTYFSVTK